MSISGRAPSAICEIFPHLEPIEGRISAEQILCGRGIVNLYRAICKVDGIEPTIPRSGRHHLACACRQRRGGRRDHLAVFHLSRPRRRRHGDDLHGARRRLSLRRHFAEDPAGVEEAGIPRRLRGQGAAFGAAAKPSRPMSSPIRWQRLPAFPPMRARRRVSACRPKDAAGAANAGLAKRAPTLYRAAASTRAFAARMVRDRKTIFGIIRKHKAAAVSSETVTGILKRIIAENGRDHLGAMSLPSPASSSSRLRRRSPPGS